MDINIAIVGFGYWGKNIVRNFNSLDSCHIKYVCEKDRSKGEQCKQMYSSVEIISDLVLALEDSDVNEIFVYSPLTCESRNGICSRCYGIDLGSDKIVDLGEAVGTVRCCGDLR